MFKYAVGNSKDTFLYISSEFLVVALTKLCGLRMRLSLTQPRSTVQPGNEASPNSHGLHSWAEANGKSTLRSMANLCGMAHLDRVTHTVKGQKSVQSTLLKILDPQTYT